MKRLLLLIVAGSLCSPAVMAQQGEEDIAMQLANPIAALISVPIQANYDENYGANDEGSITRINIQPVIPISLSDEWNLISRTILPLVDQNDFPAKGLGERGLGDTVQSLFFSPKALTGNGWTWGAGPVLLLPTATDDLLGGKKWGLGPTAVALKQSGPWTYGGLANHIISVGGDSDRADINATFIQPFLSYVTKHKTTLSLNLESTYDWEGDDWSIPVNLMVNQLTRVGSQLIQVGAGVRYWASSPDGGPEDIGFRLNFVLLFPK